MAGKLDVRLQIESICNKFEVNWDASLRGSLVAEYVAAAPTCIQAELLTELVATECELLDSAGHKPDRLEYLSRFPELGDAIDTGLREWEVVKAAGRPVADEIPAGIGEYRILREIGRGGTGIVYEAIHDRLSRRVAVKILSSHPSRFQEKRSRFEREATSVARLHHKNIATIYEYAQEDGLPYFVMQLIDGKSLRERIEDSLPHQPDSTEKNPTGSPRERPLTADESAAIIRDAAYALAYSHEQGVLHRDVKPSNLLLDADNHIYVVDFGIAKFKDDDSNITITGEVVGTPRYVPPEAFAGVRDEQSDIYSLGLTLYELLAQEPAFTETDLSNLIQQITQQTVRFSAEQKSHIPGDLQTIALNAVALDPRDRYQSARAFADDLQRYLSSQPIHARRAGPLERLAKWSKRNPLVSVLTGLLVLMTLLSAPTIAWLRASATSANAVAALEKADKESALALAKAEAVRVTAARTARLDTEYAFLIRDVDNAIQQGRFAYASQLMDTAENQSTAERSDSKDTLLFGANGTDRRGWEWNYLRNQLDMSCLAFRAHEPALPEFDAAPIGAMAVSPDDSLVATAMESVIGDSGTMAYYGELAIRELSTGRLVHRFQCEEFITDVSFSPDSRLLATISLHNKGKLNLQGFVRIRDIKSGRLVHTIELKEDFTNINWRFSAVQHPRPRVRFDHSGEYLLTSFPLTAFHTKDWQQAWTHAGGLGTILPNNQVIGVGKSALTRHNLTAGELIEKTAFKSSGRPGITSLGTDQFFMLESNSTELSVWSTHGNKAKPVNKFKVPISLTAKMAPNGRSFVRSGTDGIRLYSVSPSGEPKLVRELRGHKDMVTHVDFSSDGQRLITADFEGWVRVWNLYEPGPAEPLVFKENSQGGSAVDAIAFDQDADRIQFACSRFRSRIEQNRGASGWFALTNPDPKPQSNGGRFREEIQTTRKTVWPRTDFAFSPKGTFFAAPAMEHRKIPIGKSHGYCTSGQINIWSADNSKLIDTINLETRHIVSICWSPDQSRLAIATIAQPSPGVRLTDDELLAVESQVAVVAVSANGTASKHVRWYAFDSPLALADLCFVPNRNALAISGTTGTHLLCLESGRETTIQTLQRGRSTIDVNSAGNRIAVADFDVDTVRIHDLVTGDPPIEIQGPRFVSSIKFSPDGRRLAFVGISDVAYLCDARSGHRLLELSSRPADLSDAAQAGPVLVGGDRIGLVAFSADGKRIATNGPGRQITVWNVGPSQARNGVNAAQPLGNESNQKPRSHSIVNE